jgi:PAS domain S-box-containing protein
VVASTQRCPPAWVRPVSTWGRGDCTLQGHYHAALHMKRFRHGTVRYLSTLWASGIAALAIATWLCFRLGLPPASTACVYLVIIVVLSLLDSFVSSALFSVIAVGCLDYFFFAPRYDFQVANVDDFTTLAAFLVTSLVITTLVRRLHRLGQAHAEQARLLDLTRDSVLVRDLGHVITYWNRGGEELYGWTRGEAIGKVAHDLLKTTFPILLEEINDTLLRDGRWEGELRHRRRDGTPLIVASRWSLQRDEKGVSIGTLESNTDVTQRRQAEDKVRQTQETYLAEAQQLSHTGSFGWNVVTGNVFLSDEGRRIFEWPANETLTLEKMLSRSHPEDLPHIQTSLARAAKDPRDFEFEHRLLLPSGAVKHVQVVARPMTNAERTELIGAVMDVTAIRAAENALRTARSELAHVMRVTSLGELTASIAHEVNQPLGAVVANAEACIGWLDREQPDLVEARAAIDRIVNDGLRAGEVIRRIRELVKRAESEVTPLDINEVVLEAVAFLRHELERSGVSVQMELDTEAINVLADRIQLQQVLINLVMNAIEAMQTTTDRPRNLRIRTRHDGAKAQVAVMDGGVGIPQEHIKKMFEAFFTTKSSGMGMGLSICRSIIEAHKGRIWASASESGGTTLEFSLPLHVAQSP